MRRFPPTHQAITALALLTVSCTLSRAQVTSCQSSGITVPNGTGDVTLNLASPGGGQAAALQWALNYPQDQVTNVSVVGGPALANAGKSLTCNSGSGTYTCVAWGLNDQTIDNGMVADVSLSVASDSATICVTNTLGASPDAVGVPINILLGVRNPEGRFACDSKPRRR